MECKLDLINRSKESLVNVHKKERNAPTMFCKAVYLTLKTVTQYLTGISDHDEAQETALLFIYSKLLSRPRILFSAISNNHVIKRNPWQHLGRCPRVWGI